MPAWPPLRPAWSPAMHMTLQRCAWPVCQGRQTTPPFWSRDHSEPLVLRTLQCTCWQAHSGCQHACMQKESNQESLLNMGTETADNEA